MAAKCILILIAIWSVIQGFVYGILSILALLAHDCQISMRQSKLTYLMYIIFFRDQRCEPIYWNIVADIPPLDPTEPIWPSITMVAFRTNILALVYLLLSTVWIITSLMLIVGCFMSCFGKVTYYLLMMPWAICCTLTSILDVVAVSFFFYDVFNTLNMDSFIRHLEMQSSHLFEINASILPMPAVILLIVASRGFIFWCLNILCIPIILTNGKKLTYDGKGKPESSDDRDFRYARNQAKHSNNNNNILESHFPATTERSRYSDPSHYHQYQYDNMSYQQDKYDLSRSIGRRYREPLKSESIDEPDSNPKRMIASRNSSNGEKSSKKSSWSDDSNNSTNTVNLAYVNNNQANPHKGNSANQSVTSKQYSWRHMPTDAVLKIDRPHFRLPSKPSLLKKLSDSSYIAQEETHHPYTDDELRSQLPWSYFDARSDVIKPKKSFNELRDDEDLPPVPVPDYTIQLPRKDRHDRHTNGERKSTPAKKFVNPKRGLSSHEQESRWSGPEYRY